MSTSGTERLWSPSFIALTAANFILAMVYYLVAMKIVEFAFETYSVTYSAAGAMVSMFAIAAVVTRVVFGGKMDTWGLRRSAVLGAAIIVVASALYVPKTGYWLLLAVRALHGIGFAINTGALAAIAALLVPKSRQGEGIGYFSLSTALAMGIGPMCAMVMTNHGVSYLMLFVFTLIISVASFVAVCVVKVPEPSRAERLARHESRVCSEGRECCDPAKAEPPVFADALDAANAADAADALDAADVVNSTAKSKAPKVADTLDSPKASKAPNGLVAFLGKYLHVGVLPLASVAIPIMFCYSGVLSFMTSFAAERGLNEAASVYFLVYAVAMLITRPAMGRRLDKRGENAVLYYTLTAASIGLLLLAFAFNPVVLLLSAALLGFGVGATQSSVQALVSKYSAQEDLGKANSTYFFCLDAGMGIGPMVIGFILPTVGYLGLFVILSLIAFAACIYYGFVHGRKVGK